MTDAVRRGPTIRHAFIASFAIFAFATVCSAFLRSDGFALPGIADGSVRCGFPWVFWEQGGFVGTQGAVSLAPLAFDIAASLMVGFAGIRLFRVRRRSD